MMTDEKKYVTNADELFKAKHWKIMADAIDLFADMEPQRISKLELTEILAGILVMSGRIRAWRDPQGVLRYDPYDQKEKN